MSGLGLTLNMDDAISFREMKKRKLNSVPDRHVLYTAAVQSLDADLKFARKAHRHFSNRKPVDLREDFCGTAALACKWVRRHPERRAWGVDLDPETLEWGRRHYLAKLGDSAERVSLIQDDVLSVKTPKVDIALALNFSYFIFKERDVLLRYFENVRESLKPGGVIVMDIFGGSGALDATVERRDVVGEDEFDGTPVPDFEFIWDQVSFNVITNEILCHIHFKVPGFKKIREAFTYDWRVWTIPEVRELLAEAGFSDSVVYGHGWDDDCESDGNYNLKSFMENEEGWLAYVVGCR